MLSKGYARVAAPPPCSTIRSLAGYARFATTQSNTASTVKAAGDISSGFPSLSGAVSPPVPARFADLKSKLSLGRKDQIRESWRALLLDLKRETEEVKAHGSAIIPEIEYRDLVDVEKRTKFRDSLRKRGVAIVRSVVTESEALKWKELLERYIKSNPTTRGRLLSSLSFYGRSIGCFNQKPIVQFLFPRIYLIP